MTDSGIGKSCARQAYAKINLSLDVTGRRADGYHLVRMIMQTIGIHDTLHFQCGEEAPEGEEPQIRVRICRSENNGNESDLEGLTIGEDNLITRAVRTMYKEYGLRNNLDIELTKRIPVAAGLAGGSTDAAAAFRAVRDLYGLNVPDEKLRELALPLGADIPYCIAGGTRLCEGIGEELTVLPPAPKCALILVKPEVGVPTVGVYKALDAIGEYEHPDVDGMIRAIREEDLRGVSNCCGNVLELVTGAEHPVIGLIEEFFMAHGALNAKMSGSGPSVFAIYEDPETAQEALAEFESDVLSEGCRAFLTEFVPDTEI